MPGFRTYNQTNQPMWVTIYTVGGGVKEDWGNVDAGTSRDWNSGHYVRGSYYKVRGQWPTTNSKFDTDTTTGFGSSDPRELVLLGGDSGVYWSSPIVRTENLIDFPVWVTIYSGAGEGEKSDYGDVEKGATRDWAAGEYSSGTILTLLAEWNDPVATTQDRLLQAAPPTAAAKYSVKSSRMFGPLGNGIAHSRLELKGGKVVWTNVDGG